MLGLPVAALYDQAWTRAIHGPFDLAIVPIAFTLFAPCRRLVSALPVGRAEASVASVFPNGISVLYGKFLVW